MITATKAFSRYGDPTRESNMTRWVVPPQLRRGPIPKAIYCNRDLVPCLQRALTLLISRELIDELKIWDGCFAIRQARGLDSMSLHSWGLAVDVNAATNRLHAEPTLSPEFVQCWVDAGFEWGGTWKRKDGMHFQLATFPE